MRSLNAHKNFWKVAKRERERERERERQAQTSVVYIRARLPFSLKYRAKCMTASFYSKLFWKLFAVGIIVRQKKKMSAFFTAPTFVPFASRLVFLGSESFSFFLQSNSRSKQRCQKQRFWHCSKGNISLYCNTKRSQDQRRKYLGVKLKNVHSVIWRRL